MSQHEGSPSNPCAPAHSIDADCLLFLWTLQDHWLLCPLSPRRHRLRSEALLSNPKPKHLLLEFHDKGLFTISNPSKEPVILFRKMVKRGYPNPNTYTMAFVLKACSIVSAMEEGQQVHASVLKSGFGSSPFVEIALANFYAKCEDIVLARKVFDEITDKNLVAWSTMISGYPKIGLVNEALSLFRDMQKAGVVPDEVTMVSVISACAASGALDTGRWVHAYIKK